MQQRRHYLKKEIAAALSLYDELESVTAVIQQLGYPTRTAMYQWIYRREKSPPPRLDNHGKNTPDHPRHPSVETKLKAIRRCFENGEDIKWVSDEIGYSRASIYNWRRRYWNRGQGVL